MGNLQKENLLSILYDAKIVRENTEKVIPKLVNNKIKEIAGEINYAQSTGEFYITRNIANPNVRFEITELLKSKGYDVKPHHDDKKCIIISWR